MTTMVCAYVLAGAVVVLYLTWLGVQNGRLARRVKDLERRTKTGAGADRSWSNVA